MLKYSEMYPDDPDGPFPITMEELGVKVDEIPGGDVTLCPLLENDAPDYFLMINDDRDHLRKFDDGTADKYPDIPSVEASINDPDNPMKLRFGIWRNQEMVGSINLTPITDDEAKIGYFIGGSHTGHNYATQALTAFSDFAFEALGYKSLRADVVLGNTASQRVLEKCDFTPFGYFRETSTDEVEADKNLIHRIYTKQAPTEETPELI